MQDSLELQAAPVETAAATTMMAARTVGMLNHAPMKAAKLLVLLGGILGIVAFFTPIVTGERAGKSVSISAFQVFTGAGALKEEVDKTTSVQGMSDSELAAKKKDVTETLSEIKGIVLGCFIPGFIMALVGVIAVIRGKLERLGGTLVLVLALLTLAIWALLSAGFGETNGEVDKGVAMWLLLGTGLLGLAGGVMALVNPDRGRAAVAT